MNNVYNGKKVEDRNGKKMVSSDFIDFIFININ